MEPLELKQMRDDQKTILRHIECLNTHATGTALSLSTLIQRSGNNSKFLKCMEQQSTHCINSISKEVELLTKQQTCKDAQLELINLNHTIELKQAQLLQLNREYDRVLDNLAQRRDEFIGLQQKYQQFIQEYQENSLKLPDLQSELAALSHS